MKGLKRSSKIIFVINSLVAFLLLISYVLPYIPPKNFASLSVLSLSVPLLILLNFIFFLYWLLRVKKQLLLSLIVLILGWNHISTMYKFSSSNDVEDINNFSIMTYNVRVLNAFNWLPNKTVRQDVISFIQNENPDVLCIQEYTRGTPIKLVGYHDFNATYDKTAKNGLVIYSRFPIIKSGSLEFPNTVNNGIFVDIVKQKDTIRIYNLHLQSAKIKIEAVNLKKESSGQLFKQVSSTFKEQQEQVELFLKHKSKCTHKTIVTGDFNNTSYSYIYKAIKGDDFNDTFEEAGNGFGRTFDFKFFPLRIDFILADKDFKVNGFKTYDIKLSDHYPIKATLKLH
jgi:endonuclease/exonuclease/phosphatase family metal-dependent hydrolase